MTFASSTDNPGKLLGALALAMLIAVAQDNPAVAATDEKAAQNKAIVEDAFEGWVNGGGNVFGLLSPDVRWTIHGSGPVADLYEGVEDFVQRGSAPLITRLATPLIPQIHNIWAVDDLVIIRFDASATTTSGAPYRNQFVWIWRMENGTVIEAEAFLDLVAYQDVVDNNEPRQQ